LQERAILPALRCEAAHHPHERFASHVMACANLADDLVGFDTRLSEGWKQPDAELRSRICGAATARVQIPINFYTGQSF
jgi:hypothetical protein